MTRKQLEKFIKFLTCQNLVYAPQRIDGELVIEQVNNPKKVELTNEIPLHSFKKFLVPPYEVLFNYQKNKIISSKILSPAQVIFGLTITDLKAILMLNYVFENDPYYQERLKKTIIIGHSLIPKESFQFFIEKFKEDILEHLRFDIFLAVRKNEFRVYTGSEDGQKILDEFGYKDYKHIEFAGPICEEGVDPQLKRIRRAMKKSYNQPIWEELGKICIECGKCSMICPTCFCFDIFDQPDLEEGTGKRVLAWSCCFYTDFSEVAGLEIEQKKPKFLNTTTERIRFWYEHKFVRIPDEFSLLGCVGCGRCTKVCPVGIDIKKNLRKILKSPVK